MFILKNVSRLFKNGKIHALNDISLSFADSGLISICGKTGSGKTTLLNLLGLLDSPSEGEIIYNGVHTECLKGSDKDNFRNNYIGFVSQDYGLIPELNVYENCSLAVELQNNNSDGNKAVISSLLKKVGMEGYENRKINELSGGEKQRVSIVRSLAKKSRVLLCDEPTGNLDTDTSEDIMRILKDLSSKMLVVVVTHNKYLAEKFSDRIIEIANGVVTYDSEKEIVIPKIKQKSDSLNGCETKKARTSLKYKLKISAAEMWKQKWITVVVIILTTLAFCILNVSNFMSMYSYPSTLSRTMRNHGIYSVHIGKFLCSVDEDGNGYTVTDYEKKSLDDIDAIKSVVPQANLGRVYTFSKTFYDFSECGQLNPNKYNVISFCQFTVVDDFEDLHYKLKYGQYPSGEYEVLIFDYMAYNMMYYSLFDEIKSEEDFIGFTLSDRITGMKMTISGIIESDYADYENEYNGIAQSYYTNAHLSLLRGVFGGPEFEKIFKQEIKYASILDSMICNSSDESTIFELSKTKIYYADSSDNLDIIYSDLEPEEYDENRYYCLISDVDLASFLKIDITELSVQVIENFFDDLNTTKSNLTLGYDATLYGTVNTWDKYSYESYNKYVSLKVVAGVYRETDNTYHNVFYRYCPGDGSQILNELNNCGEFIGYELLLTDSNSKNSDLFEQLILHDHTDEWWSTNTNHNEEGFYVNTYYSFVLVDVDQYLKIFALLLDKYYWLMLAAIIIAVFAYAIQTVIKNKYTIGILKSLGVTDGSIISIHSIQVVIVLLLAFMLSIPASYLLTQGVNALFSQALLFEYDFYGFNVHSFLMLLLYSSITLILSLVSVFTYLLIQSPVRLIHSRKE